MTTYLSSGLGAATPLSPIIEPALAELAADPGTVDLRPWREPIRKAMRTHRCDAIDGALLVAYRLGTACRMDDVMPGGRLRKALDELLAKGRG